MQQKPRECYALLPSSPFYPAAYITQPTIDAGAARPPCRSRHLLVLLGWHQFLVFHKHRLCRCLKQLLIKPELGLANKLTVDHQWQHRPRFVPALPSQKVRSLFQ